MKYISYISSKVIKALTIILFFLPYVTFAQNFGGTQSIISGIASIVDMLIPVVFALILLAFFWGLAKYVYNSANTDAREQGKQIMIGGIIALFVATSIWGIVKFIQIETIGLNDDGYTPPTPQAPE